MVPHLLAAGHTVTVLDTMWFGKYLGKDNKSLSVVNYDVRQAPKCEGYDAVIWLASISNNDFCTMYPTLAKQVNEDAFAPWLAAARQAGVKKFIYASSVAVYGSTIKDVSEYHRPQPTTMYAVGKRHCEIIALAPQTSDMQICVTRSASVCGGSSSTRFDVTVNRMVHDAIRRGTIVVNGGKQKRCHIHIYDITQAYLKLLATPHLIGGHIFNFVAENQHIAETAQIVAEETGAKILVGPDTDNRSYTVDGTKAEAVLGFTPTKTVRDAVRGLKVGFDSDALGITRTYEHSDTDKRYMRMADGLA